MLQRPVARRSVAENVCDQFIQLLLHPFDAPPLKLGDSGTTSFLAALYVKSAFSPSTNPEGCMVGTVGMSSSHAYKLHFSGAIGTNWTITDVPWSNYAAVAALGSGFRPICYGIRMQTREPATAVQGLLFGGQLPWSGTTTPITGTPPSAIQAAPATQFTSSNTIMSSWVPAERHDLESTLVNTSTIGTSFPYVGFTGMTNATSVYHVEAIHIIQMFSTTPSQMQLGLMSDELHYTITQVWDCFIARGRPRAIVDDTPFTIGNHFHSKIMARQNFSDEAKSGWFA